MLQKNAKKENFRSFISWQKPVKVKTMPEKIRHLLQAQPAITLLLLACYCGSAMMRRRNDNCVDPNQTDS